MGRIVVLPTCWQADTMKRLSQAIDRQALLAQTEALLNNLSRDLDVLQGWCRRVEAEAQACQMASSEAVAAVHLKALYHLLTDDIDNGTESP